MFEINIYKKAQPEITTHSASFDTEQEALDWFNSLNTGLYTPFGKGQSLKFESTTTPEERELAIEVIPEQLDEEGNVLIETQYIFDREFDYTIVDRTEEFAAQKAIEDLIEQGRELENRCKRALAYITGYNETRELSPEQITQMQITFSNIFNLLIANRPNSARGLVELIEVDGTIVTEQLKNGVLTILEG